jgi:hypothetical protein
MSRTRTLSRLGLALALISPALHAQEGADAPLSVPFQVSEALQGWQKEHGASWHVHTDARTGLADFLYGGKAAPAFEPIADADFATLARLAVEGTQDLHGVESSTLKEARTLHLPLGLIDSTDKMTVRFTQQVNGVPVLGGFVNALFDMGGNLLSLQTTAAPGVAGLSTDAVVSPEAAAKQALARFEAETGLPGRVVAGPAKAIGRLESGKAPRPALVWQVDVQWSQDGAEPEGYTYWVDAVDGGVVHQETSIHHFDVGGTLSTLATGGVYPDTASNPEVPLPMNRARVTGSGGAGTVYTDANGNFNFPGVNGPINITVEYFGDWADVRNNVGADHTETFNGVSGTGNVLTMNSATPALVTSQANSFLGIGELRDWIRSVNPSDGTADFRAVSNNNLTSTCNAYFDGSSVNFYQAGGGCPNTAYSTVVAHEMGHWFNVLYGTGNGSDGMGEGNADVWAILLYNTPLLGADFITPGSPLRNGNNQLQFCGDNNPGCHGGGSVHTNGQVWMGAVWKVYKRIRDAYDLTTADMVTDALFLGWMNSYNQTQIKSVIETQWLTLDDDNGNIDDGTPHYPQIDGGFREQGFPGYDLALIGISGVTQLPDQNSEIGPYVVDAAATSLIGSTITGLELFYSVDGGNFTALPMSSTGGNGYTAGIPGQVSPAVVRYYVQATDSLGNVETFPDDAPADLLDFLVGVQTVYYFEDFENGEAGWTHDTFGTTSNSQDDWQYGTPNGSAGDPNGAASGSFCWGNDLAPSGWNGAYQDNVYNYLRSPLIDCSGATGAKLRFKRWLTVEAGQFDQARLRVNGQLVWQNPNATDLVDTSWTEVEYDISSIADGNPAVRIEFSLQSDGGVVFGGWTVDDIEILSVGPTTGSCVDPIAYGQGKLNSVGGIAFLTSFGAPSEAAGSFSIDVNQAVPNTFGILISSASSASVPFLGGTRLVGTPFQRELVFQTDALGFGSALLPVPAGSSGTDRYFQAWYRDTAQTDGTGAGLSNGLQVRFCD